MARNDMADLFNVNRSVTSAGSGSRPMRLPTMSQFPKLNQRKISQPALIDGPAGRLPEMTTDVIDVTAGYAVENVRRNRADRRPSGLRLWLGRMLGGEPRVVGL